MSSSGEASPGSSTPATTPGLSSLTGANAPKFGTVIPNRIFVGGIAPNTSEQELKTFFGNYGVVKDSKIIADRAGVSKGYGFITFETQEDAEKIIKKESDNLVFKDRKLNIGPAVRKQQAFPRLYDDLLVSNNSRSNESAVSPGTVLFTNGVPYTYHNGMAIFHAGDGSYTIPAQPQLQSAYPMMLPHQPMVMSPTYAAYPSPQTGSQWTAAANQWTRSWAPQSPTPAAVAGTQYLTYPAAAVQHLPEVMYAQPPPTYQTTDITDASMIEATPAEGSMVPISDNMVQHTYIDVKTSTTEMPTSTMQPTAPQPQQTTTATPAIIYKKPPQPVVLQKMVYKTPPSQRIPQGTQCVVMTTHVDRMDLESSPDLTSVTPLTPPPTPECS